MKKDESITTAWHEFGSRLRDWRSSARLTQGELCARVGEVTPRLTQTKLSHIETGDVEPPNRPMCLRIERALGLPEGHVWAFAAEARTSPDERAYWRSRNEDAKPRDLDAYQWDIVRDVARLDRGLSQRIAELSLGPDARGAAQYIGVPRSVGEGLAALLFSLVADPGKEGKQRGPAADAFADALSHFADLGPYTQRCVLEVFNGAVRAAMANAIEHELTGR